MVGTCLFGGGYAEPDWQGIVDNFSLSKVKPFVGKVRLVGSHRLRFDKERPLENAIHACVHFGATKDHCLDLYRVLSYVRSEFRREYDRTPDDAELSVLLKTVDFWCGSWSGFYTLFNKLSIDPKADSWSIFEPRISSWLLQDRGVETADVIWPYFEQVINSIGDGGERMSFTDFLLNRDLWAASGATDNKEEVAKYLTKTKGGFAYSVGDSKLLKWWEKNRDSIRPWSLIKKEEPGAVRLVVLTDIVTYLKQAWLLRWWDRACSDHPWLHAFSTDPAKWWLQFQEFVQNNYGAEFLLGDYQNFDESATRELIRRFVRKLVERCGLPVDEEFAHVDGLVDQLYNAQVVLPTGEVADVVNGLASGLRITTLFNSIFNAALMLMACEKLGNDPRLLRFLGDDSVVHLSKLLSVKEFSDAIAPSGVTLHLRKSYVSTVPEFLKLTLENGLVRGNPLRALRSVLWSSEDEKDNSTNISVANQRVSIWAKFYSRARLTPYFRLSTVVSDIERAAKMDRKTVTLWMSTPSSSGGGGWIPEFSLLWGSVSETDPVKAPIVPIRRPVELDRLWRAGIRQRIEGLMTVIRRQGAFGAVQAGVTRFARTLSWDKPRPIGIRPPDSRNHDVVAYSFKGIRSRRDFREHAQHLSALSYSNYCVAAKLANKFSEPLFVQFMAGADPTLIGVSPWMTLCLGEVFDQFPSRQCSNTVRFNLSGKVSSGFLISLKNSVEATLFESIYRRFYDFRVVPSPPSSYLSTW